MDAINQSTTAEWDSQLEAARQGDRNAIGEIGEQYRAYLLLIADRGLTRLRGKLNASDVVQQSMIELQADLPRFVGESEQEFRAWVTKLVKHNLLDMGRRYRNTRCRNVARERSSNVGGKPLDVAGNAKTASSILVRRETDSELLQAIAQLPPRRSRIIELRHRKGMRFAEIGAELGITAVAARQLWSRTLDELRGILTNLHGDRPTQPR